MTEQSLIQAACEARKLAYVPYSNFPVGAAVLTESGLVFSGCNIENASYGLTVCAERTAIFQAIAAGEKRLSALAVIADTPGPTAPCGSCRQVMAEFHIKTITMANIRGEWRTVELNELLPYAFSSEDMGSEPNEV